MKTTTLSARSSRADLDTLLETDPLQELLQDEKLSGIVAARADEEDDDEDLDEEDDALADDDDSLDDDALDKEFEEFDLPKGNRGAGAKKDTEDDEFGDLGLDTGGGLDDEEDDF
jgi:hypothetical protein